MKKIPLKLPYLYLLLLMVGSLPLWLHIDQLPVRVWDEAKNSVHAIEMYSSGEWRYRAINGAPDISGIKPPLLIWLQAVGLKIFGLNEIGLRWPSIAAGILLCAFIMWFLYQREKMPIAAGMAPLILVSMPAYLGPHMARTGDHDSLLLLFGTAGTLSFYDYLKREKNIALIASCAFFALGVLTKSIAPLMLLPGILLYTLSIGKLRSVLLNKSFWLSTIISVTFIGLVYALREQQDPGYLNRVWNDELFPRYMNFSENYEYEKQSFWYYFKAFPQRLGWWFWLMIPAGILQISLWRKDCNSLGHFLFAVLFFFIMVISYGTKNFWYDGPALPLFAVLIAISAERVLQYMQFKSSWPKRMIIIVGLLLILEHPYREAIQRVVHEKEHWWDREIYGVSYQLRSILKADETETHYKVLYPDPVGYIPWLFYQKAIEQKHPQTKVLHVKREDIEPGDLVICSQQSEKDWLTTTFLCSIEQEIFTSSMYRIEGKK